jgi:hypothetical protein
MPFQLHHKIRKENPVYDMYVLWLVAWARKMLGLNIQTPKFANKQPCWFTPHITQSPVAILHFWQRIAWYSWLGWHCWSVLNYLYICISGQCRLPLDSKKDGWMQGNVKLGQLGCCILKQPEICNTEFTSGLLSMSALIMVLSVKVCPSLGLSLTL